VVSDARAEDHEILNAAFEPPDELIGCMKRAFKTNFESVNVLRNLLVSMAIDG
jgi:hypothetical protein